MKITHAVAPYTFALMLGVAGLGRTVNYGDPSGNTPANNAGNPGMSGASNPSNNGPYSSHPPTVSLKILTGMVQSVDLANKTLQLKDNLGRVQTLALDSTTELTRGGDSVQLSDLQLGDTVSIKSSKM